MKKYHSQNSLEIFLPFLLVLILMVILKIIYVKYNLFVFVTSLLFSLAILIYSIIKTRASVFDIYLLDDKIEIKYSYSNKIETLSYSEILEYHFIRTNKSNTDCIKYSYGKKSFPSVENKNTIEYIKWLKEKNPEIKIVIFPSDATLEYEYQKEFEFKFRKFHKDSLN